ncbi:glycosyltransferase [Psychroflexus planctonicus]|uniref:Glycosyl transferase n=1 Tax=Psychroflexus planctonicus TaxID=1526575 RepID=A0ABQ1SEW2_9FLAO|nr:glycosyltransferase [Psychroflexus planctonicus]GGE32272.1 glycosyl transferase [Psychroflexus planctonicus]
MANQKKILFAINHLTYGGIQTQAITLAKEFRSRGAKIYFFWTDKFDDDFVDRELRQNGFEIIDGKFIKNQYWAKYSRHLNRYVPLIKAILLMRYYRIDYIIPYHNPLCYFFGAIHPYTSAKLTVYHIRNTVLENEPKQSWQFKKALNHASIIIANSNHARLKFKEVYGKHYDLNIRTIHNGIKLREIDNNTDWKTFFKVKDYNFIVTSLANFFKDKDYTTIFKAWSIFIKKTNSKSILLVAGDEGIEGFKLRYQSEVQNLGLENKVRFIGRTSYNLELLSISNCNILSTLNEGLPNSVIETLGMKTPFIGAKVDGVEEVVGENYPIPRFAVGDHQQLADILFKLYNREYSLEEINSYSSKRFQKFSIDKLLKEYSKIIKV